jgi:hypothetical protein
MERHIASIPYSTVVYTLDSYSLIFASDWRKIAQILEALSKPNSSTAEIPS